MLDVLTGESRERKHAVYWEVLHMQDCNTSHVMQYLIGTTGAASWEDEQGNYKQHSSFSGTL